MLQPFGGAPDDHGKQNIARLWALILPITVLRTFRPVTEDVSDRKTPTAALNPRKGTEQTNQTPNPASLYWARLIIHIMSSGRQGSSGGQPSEAAPFAQRISRKSESRYIKNADGWGSTVSELRVSA